jgi:mannitol/fructose-specific phosphotransferase system IIA component (Ntr-type)
MMLNDLMDPRTVEMDLCGDAPSDVLRTLVDRLVAAGLIANGADALQRLEEREKVMSTGIGGGIAIPHARTPAVDRTLVALGRSHAGVPFNAVDAKPVQIVFLILGPPDSSAEHVKVLARIARLVKRPGFLPAAAAAETAAALLAMIAGYEDSEGA